MSKKTVKNTCNQPLYLNLLGDRSIKIKSRGKVEIEDEYLHSSEIDFHRTRGNIVILEERESTRQKKVEIKKDVENIKKVEDKKKEDKKIK
ncbi:MAG: hypothetical protein JXB49_05350 [Bacteroidales bacterium]|nr:hypothetical protein [Bacteroidales bacterium]